MSDAPSAPPQRKVPCRIYTSSGWILGTFHVPIGDTLLEHVDEHPFFTLTEVKLPRQTQRLSFLALQRAATILVLPGEEEESQPVSDGSVHHQVSCLLDGGVVMGALHLEQRLRVSDHLMTTDGFFVLRDCTVGLDSVGGKGSVEAAPLALVNAARVVGVAEM